jgi:hypothetical protein
MSRWVGLALFAACTGRGPEATAPAATDELRTVEPAAVVAPEVEAPRASCLASAAAGQHPLVRVGTPVAIGERTFAYGWRQVGADVEVVIVSLAGDGAPVITPVPVPYADPTAIGADGRGLVIVSVALKGTGTLLRVTLGEDGVLRAGTPMPLPDVAWGWPAKITSDGARAVLVHTLATTEQTLGRTVIHTIELASGRVVASTWPPAGATMDCDTLACTTIALEKGSGRAGFTWVGPGGREDRAVAVASACPAFYAIEAAGLYVGPGDPWRAMQVTATAPHLTEVAIDRSLAAVPGCGSTLYPFPSALWPGVIEGTRARSLLRWDTGLRTFGAREPLPDPGFDRTILADHTDGVIEVGWTGWHGMQHSPTDAQGRRRYFEHWSFDGGRVALLRRERGQWAAVDAVPLALGAAEGTFHDGYFPVVLRHGLHAAVLLAPQGGGDPAWFQPYLRPCG